MAVEKKNAPRRPTVGRARSVNGVNGKAALRGEAPETLVNYYREMVLIRRFEQRAGEIYPRARIGGCCHLNLGEEATIGGLMAALEPRDYLLANYREHGYALARGI